ncbi:MAG: fumarate hydratase [Clostridia bacterium]|nr:fumarate hydratase [Clostridia bacterium]
MNVREINAGEITENVALACVDANKILPADLRGLIESSCDTETSELGKSIMRDLCRNLDAAAELDIPICQDTGMTVVFAEIGQDVHIVGGSFEAAVNEGVRRGYERGYLRKSIVGDPLRRVNTNDNTPAVIHTSIVDGDNIRITVAPKGFGSENMSRIRMFTPAASVEDIIAFVVETVNIAGGNPCPPIVLGIGIGGDFEKCALLSKKALCRSVGRANGDKYYAALEKRILDAVNKTGIGPQGFGGDTTCLAVNIESCPTHVAGLPVAVNVGCHVTRHVSFTL